ncbi:hypothetical protein AMTR_s00185p00036330 [Amborella trichopoda]|uniref:Uncharacterized protein n=1 Tax=Amborella trichopoda TaxID=13333 RepID=U5CWX2_AMBTC|nr:hypothetical protein AMTR_s00185p00036330 [Amborella trichopoda]
MSYPVWAADMRESNDKMVGTQVSKLRISLDLSNMIREHLFFLSGSGGSSTGQACFVYRKNPNIRKMVYST